MLAKVEPHPAPNAVMPSAKGSLILAELTVLTTTTNMQSTIPPRRMIPFSKPLSRKVFPVDNNAYAVNGRRTMYIPAQIIHERAFHD